MSAMNRVTMTALKALGRRLLPAEVYEAFQVARSLRRDQPSGKESALLMPQPRTSVYQHCFGYAVRVHDSLGFHQQYKDAFINGIYYFHAMRPDPLIIDGGSNMGVSILYFKHIYPEARVIGFEPDPVIFRTLQDNISRNGIQGVTLINAGLGASTGPATFLPDGADGGRLAEPIGRPPGPLPVDGVEGGIQVQLERLSEFLAQPVDFLKLNVEGAELPVLEEAEASGRLAHVRELVVEYHGWAGGEQRLGALLNLLDRQGFRYLVHDFDADTGSASKPPFRLTPRTTWHCLVYGRRLTPVAVAPERSASNGRISAPAFASGKQE
jgi:FkbM family methyltransferase